MEYIETGPDILIAYIWCIGQLVQQATLCECTIQSCRYNRIFSGNFMFYLENLQKYFSPYWGIMQLHVAFLMFPGPCIFIYSIK
jgi:hypothetical protein